MLIFGALRASGGFGLVSRAYSLVAGVDQALSQSVLPEGGILASNFSAGVG